MGNDKASQKVRDTMLKIGLFNVTNETEIRNKIVRISSMKASFDNKIIMILKNNPIEKDLQFQYLQYNEKDSTHSRKDDGLDALEKCYAKAEPFLTRYVRKKHGLKTGSFSSMEVKYR